MNAALKCKGNTPDDTDLLNSSVMNGASTSTFSFKIGWKWANGALLLRKFAGGRDDVIIGEDAKRRKVTVWWYGGVTRRCSVSGGRTDAGDLLVEKNDEVLAHR